MTASKIATAEFYFERILPRAKGHADSMLAPTKYTQKLPIEQFGQADAQQQFLQSIVVDHPGDAAAFVFLGGEKLAQQHGPLLVAHL